MKRSQINAILRQSQEMIHHFGFALPNFAYWSPYEFKAQLAKVQHIVSARVGWDVTDFNTGDYKRWGLSSFTLRNGRIKDMINGKGMCYAEKLLIMKIEQKVPMHTHIVKTEDIINRGGGILVVELYGSDDRGNFAPELGGTVMTDGLVRTFEAGETIRLRPGESITLVPGDWHSFWSEEEDVLVGEVSTVNDDENDNIFKDFTERFSFVEEDSEPLHLLVNDYATYFT